MTVISVFLILIAIGLYRAHPIAIAAVVGPFALVSWVPAALTAHSSMLIFPAVLAVWAICRWRDVNRVAFSACACLAVVAGWGVAAALFIPKWQAIQQLAAEYPVVQIDQRLAYEQNALEADLSATALDSMQIFSSRIESIRPSEPWAGNERWTSLMSLEATHDNFVAAFTRQEGFGIGRMYRRPASREYIELAEPTPLALLTPAPRSVSAGVDESTSPVGDEDASSYTDFHHDQSVNFANPAGFGYAIDREWFGDDSPPATRIRGFQPHAFREMPGDAPAGDDWQLVRLELVSLLKHDPPAVYLSEHLPRMQELAADGVPTRSLDSFETASLNRLLEGETIVAEQSRNRVLMLGGLRAAYQCTQCHNVNAGHLLGAFSYEFRRKKPLPPPKEERPAPTKPLT